VQEAVLLGQPVAEGERDIDFTGRYVDKFCAERRHVPLTGEAVADPRLNVDAQVAKAVTWAAVGASAAGRSELDHLGEVVDLIGVDPDRVRVGVSREGLADLLQRLPVLVDHD
jgi:hypothetical protein